MTMIVCRVIATGAFINYMTGPAKEGVTTLIDNEVRLGIYTADQLEEVEMTEAEAYALCDAAQPEPDYAKKRRRAYASWSDQLDMQYWDAVNGTSAWLDHVASVKAAHPKPE